MALRKILILSASKASSRRTHGEIPALCQFLSQAPSAVEGCGMPMPRRACYNAGGNDGEAMMTDYWLSKLFFDLQREPELAAALAMRRLT